MPNDTVELQINGVSLSGWDGVTIKRSIDTCADSFSVTSALDVTRPAIVGALKPFGYQTVTVKIGGDLVLTGRIESVDTEVSADDSTVSVQGRSLTGSLIDCSIDIGKYNFNGLKLSAIARTICQPFGISVDAQYDKTIAEATAEPGQGAFEFLNRLAQDIGCLLTCDSAGKLVIRKYTAPPAPVASLSIGAGSLLSASASYDGTKRFSRYKLLQQQDGKPDLKGIADDSGISAYRPLVSTGADGNATEIQDAAKWRRALSLAESVVVSASVDGWRMDNGDLWEPGLAVTLKAPGCFISKDTVFLIAETDQKLTAGDMSTDMRLILPATYSGQMPGAYPWD